MSVAAWAGGVAERWQRVPEARYLLACAPGGALCVGLVDLLCSAGYRSAGHQLLWLLVAAGYAVQLVATMRVPRLADTWWAPVVLVAAAASSPVFGVALVGARPPVVWFWLLGCVVMLAAYLCPPARSVAAGVGVSCVGVLLVRSSALPVTTSTWLLVCGTLANAVPGLATALGLGRIRRREGQVLRQTRLDPVTGILNRRGLEHELALLAGRGDGRRVSVVSLRLDAFGEAAAAWGGPVADQVLARVGGALTRAHGRTHLVARLVDHEFVVIGDPDADLLAPSLLRAVRAASPQRPVSGSAGVVVGVPVDLLAGGQLLPVLEAARALLARAQAEGGVEAVAREDFDAGSYVAADLPPRPVPPPTVPPRGAAGWSETGARLSGWWLAAAAVLLSAVPRASGWPSAAVAAGCLACLVLGAGGVLLAQRPSWGPRLAPALVLLALPTAAGVLAGAQAPEARFLVLQLVAAPVVVAAVYLPVVWVRVLVALLPAAVVVATTAGPHPSPYGLGVSVAASLFFAATALLSSGVRHRTLAGLAELQALVLVDPTTGVLTRAGLAAAFLDLPVTDRAGVLVVSVRRRTDGSGASASEADLVATAACLQGLADAGRGVVGRVGSRELALVVSTSERAALARRRLAADLARVAPQARVAAGRAVVEEHAEGALWRAVADADAETRARGAHVALQPRLGVAGGASARP